MSAQVHRQFAIQFFLPPVFGFKCPERVKTEFCNILLVFPWDSENVVVFGCDCLCG